MAMFKAFKPEAMNKIAKAMGYSGDMGQFQQYIEDDPARKARMNGFVQAAQQMAKGGVVKMQTGGTLKPGITPEMAASFPQMPTGVGPLFSPAVQTAVSKEAAPFQQGQFAPGTLAQAQNQMQMSGIQGMTPVMSDPRGIQPVTKPAANTGTVAQGVPNFRVSQPGSGSGPLVNLQTGKTIQPEYLTGSKEQYDAFRKQYMQGGPRIETADVRQLPMQGFQFQGSSTELGAFQDYLRSQQQAMDPRTAQPVLPPDYYLPGVYPPGTPLSEHEINPKYKETPTAQQDAPPAAPTTTPTANTNQSVIGEVATQRLFSPALPQGGVTTAAMTPTGPGQEVQQGTGALTGAVAVPTAMAQAATVTPQQESQANVMEAATAAPAVDAAMNATQAAQATVDPRAQVTAAQQTASSVGNLSAAQGNATLINNPVQRQIQAGELISGAADAQTAAQFTEQVQAAEATPSTQATVQGQLASLTENFDAANPPAWAAGAMRNATAAMAARGLGASSLAGQAIVQATLEAALPIAQADAATVAQFEAQNLSNRQQRAMLSAQQRAQFIGQEFDQAFQSRVQNASKISDIANMNFTAEQQVQLENSRAVNTMNLNNLSNSQAMVIAEASALAQMDLSNLNNRQQAAVNNAQAFLQTDMANLSNQQQTELFKAQQRTQSMFTDQAATNAARQFNASSQNQVDQFFANLAQQTSQFNATQQNAQAQFNAGQANTVNRFNAEMNNQRDQFNAQNQIVIAQSNAQWRRQIATADTAAVNRANEINAAAILDVSKTAYDNLWQYYADTMEWAWTSGENDKDRLTQLSTAELNAKTSMDMQKLKTDAEESGAIGGFFTDVLTSPLTGSILGKFF
jgi:hypothetical protein